MMKKKKMKEKTKPGEISIADREGFRSWSGGWSVVFRSVSRGLSACSGST